MSSDILIYAARALVLLTALPIHEAAHAWASNRLGDPTAKYMGRLTLNPLKHLDLFGSLCLMLTGIGWAKPVPVDPRYYTNKKRGMAVSAAAGPLANLLMAAVALLINRIVYFLLPASGASGAGVIAFYLFYYIAVINVSLGVFNLLPVPPFDGSRILLLFLPERVYFGLMKYERYIMLAMFALIFLGAFTVPLSFLRNAFINGGAALFDRLIEFVASLFTKSAPVVI